MPGTTLLQPQWLLDYQRASGLVLKPGGPTPEELDEARSLVERASIDSGDESLVAMFEHMVGEWLGSDQLSAYAADAPEDPGAWDYKDEDMPRGAHDLDVEKQVQMGRLAKARKRGAPA